jgi:hypothetical protein
MPYVIVSYYERCAFPLIGVKVLLMIFAGDRFLSLLFPQACRVIGNGVCDKESSSQLQNAVQYLNMSSRLR